MRMIVFFDLPTETELDRKNYRSFRRFLIKSGFVMMQESVYTKLLLNSTAENTLRESLRKNSPKKGLIQVLSITEKQFSKIEFISGTCKSDIISSDERVVFL